MSRPHLLKPQNQTNNSFISNILFIVYIYFPNTDILVHILTYYSEFMLLLFYKFFCLQYDYLSDQITLLHAGKSFTLHISSSGYICTISMIPNNWQKLPNTVEENFSH